MIRILRMALALVGAPALALAGCLLGPPEETQDETGEAAWEHSEGSATVEESGAAPVHTGAQSSGYSGKEDEASGSSGTPAPVIPGSATQGNPSDQGCGKSTDDGLPISTPCKSTGAGAGHGVPQPLDPAPSSDDKKS